MSLHKYGVFLKIVALGNITKASVELGYSQSAISNVVASLESEWNVRLFTRDKQGVKLTQEGEYLLPAIQRVVRENQSLTAMVSELHVLDTGTVNVGGFTSAAVHLLPEVMQSFSAIYPQVQFNVKMGSYYEVEELIHSGKLDCGIVKLPTKLEMDTIPLFQDRIIAIFPKGAWPEGRRFPLKEIEHEHFIMVKDVEPEVLDYLEEHNIPITNRYYSEFDYTVFPMVERGMGMCILSELLLRGTAYQVEARELDPPVLRTVGIGYRKETLTTATRRFIDHVKGSLGEGL